MIFFNHNPRLPRNDRNPKKTKPRQERKSDFGYRIPKGKQLWEVRQPK